MRLLLRKSLLAMAVCSAAGVMVPPSDAQTNIGTLPGGNDCSVAGINDSSTIIGECISSNANGEENIAIVELSGQTAPTPLPPLASGKVCGTIEVSDSGAIIGACDDADDSNTAVIWTPDTNGNYSSPPAVLLPFQGGDNVPADDSAQAGIVNAQGVAIGISVNSEGHSEAVLGRWVPPIPRYCSIPQPATTASP